MGFTFQTTRSILVEAGGSSKVGQIFKDLGCGRVLVVTDKAVERAGVLLPALRGLESSGLSHAELAEIVVPGVRGTAAQKTAALVDALTELAGELGLDTSLPAGILRDDLTKLAEDAIKQTRLFINNPREVTYDDALAIYGQAV